MYWYINSLLLQPLFFILEANLKWQLFFFTPHNYALQTFSNYLETHYITGLIRVTKAIQSDQRSAHRSDVLCHNGVYVISFGWLVLLTDSREKITTSQMYICTYITWETVLVNKVKWWQKSSRVEKSSLDWEFLKPKRKKEKHFISNVVTALEKTAAAKASNTKTKQKLQH